MLSFSARVKKELSEINNLAEKDLVKAELMGYMSTRSSNVFLTENQYNINRYSKLLNNIGEDDFSISIKGNNFKIKTKNEIKIEHEIKSDDEKKAFLRGAFLSGGTISNPQSTYHLEMIFNAESNSSFASGLLKEKQIKNNTTMREKKYIVYIEDGENISAFLAFIGANKSVLEFEDTRVIKEVRNRINRLVNCETANMKKTINTSVKQIEDIKLIKSKKQFKLLSSKEQQLAELRLQNPESSMQELAQMTTPKMSKSGAYHVMNRITKYAEKLRGTSI